MQAVTKDSIVSLKEITKQTVRTITDLQVHDCQKNYVASNAVSIAQAYFEKRAWFRAIYADDTPVGFVMLYIDDDQADYNVWRLMVDEKYQRMGFGKQGLLLAIAHVNNNTNAKRLTISYVPGVHSAVNLYQSVGFEATGEIAEGEIVMEYLFD